MQVRPIFSYQTRLSLDAAQREALDAYACLYGKVERSLLAAMQTDASINDLKRQFQPKFGITARQFNAVRVGLEGKIDSIKARRPELIADLQTRIKKAQKVVAVLALRPTQAAKLHQKRRRLHILQTKLTALQADHKAGTVRLCFGSKRLFNAQFDLQANEYLSHHEWLMDWKSSRSDQFFVLGSQDETAGNLSCQATAADFKRIDENRELLELLRKDAPELLTKQPWIESWLRSQDEFLNELAAQVPLDDAQFAPTPLGYPGHQFPRPLPTVVKPSRSRSIKKDK